jgi:hypothetical protein
MAIDWTKISKRYQGLWIAFSDDEKTVLSSGESLKKTLDLAHKKGYKNPIMFRVPTKTLPYVGKA